MGLRLTRLVDTIRADMGPFFVARVALRVNFRLDERAPDDDASEEALVDACRELGYDPMSREKK